MLRSIETGATSVSQPPAAAKPVFRQWSNNRIAADQQEASNKLLLHLRDEGLPHRLIGKELGISRRSVIKRLKKLGISGPSDFAKKQKEQRAVEKCLAADKERILAMSPAEREKYVTLRREVIRLKVIEETKQSTIALDLKISEGLVSKILIRAGLKSKERQLVSKETHDKINEMLATKSRKQIAKLLRIDPSTVTKHSSAKPVVQNATKVVARPTIAIKSQTVVGTPINWAAVLPKTTTKPIITQLRA